MTDTNKNNKKENQNPEPENAGLKQRLTEKQSSADVDKGSMSSKTSHGTDGGGQKGNVSTSGRVDRASVNEIGTDKQRQKNQILNEQIKEPENNEKKKKQSKEKQSKED